MMLAIGLIVAAVITAYVGWKLVHGHHPQFMLLAAGLVFLLISWALGNPLEMQTKYLKELQRKVESMECF